MRSLDREQETVTACADNPVLSRARPSRTLDSNGARSDVPDDTGLSVVELVGQTLLHGTVTLDIHKLNNANAHTRTREHTDSA